MINAQQFVAGAAVPIDLRLKDFYPDADNPDWTDFSMVTTALVWFRKGTSGTPVSCSATVETVDGVEVLEVNAQDAAATVTSAGTWYAQAEADLRGDAGMIPSVPITFQVVASIIPAPSSS